MAFWRRIWQRDSDSGLAACTALDVGTEFAKALVFEIDEFRCIFCGYCEVACPFDAITMGNDYEMSDYDRSDLIFTKEMLLAEPFERSPIRAEGE